MTETTVKQTESNSKITISDVANALGVSKTTVSRAISGKGRIGEETRRRVLEYIEENNYKPSFVAKGLANNKTYNIGWVMPGDSGLMDLPFFQRCMMGVSEIAAAYDYDMLFIMVFDNDISQLERVVNNEKVDGIILGRTLVEDSRTAFLKNHNIPFVAIGSSPDEDIIQIDNDHINACKELTSILAMKGMKKLALIGGDSNHVVNETRLSGYINGLESAGVPVDKSIIFMDSINTTVIDRAVDESLRNNVDCIICMDDRICYHVLNKLHKDNVSVPDTVKVASFYNSAILSSNQPAITSLQYDPKELGEVACKTLFDYIDGKEVPKKVLLSYEVLLKGSTQ